DFTDFTYFYHIAFNKENPLITLNPKNPRNPCNPLNPCLTPLKKYGKLNNG
ncbi:MAG: hypothetical protein RLZZ115_2959, partial [Cyanobacteriota bacterium]